MGTISFAAGIATAEVLVYPLADHVLEDDETVWLLVLPGEDYAAGSPDHAAGTIVVDQMSETRIEMTVVDEPTATIGNGEVVSPPASADWVHEWQSFWVEIWVSTPDTTTLGVVLPWWICSTTRTI